VIIVKYCTRALQNRINLARSPSKIILLFGARQTGKTTLLQHLVENEEAYLPAS
jgi:predicted AAA+ superfamily ATPase